MDKLPGASDEHETDQHAEARMRIAQYIDETKNKTNQDKWMRKKTSARGNRKDFNSPGVEDYMNKLDIELGIKKI